MTLATKTTDSRPVNLNLFTMRFPIMAIVSIGHRLSGVLLFLLIPGLLWALQRSLNSPDDYADLVLLLTKPWAKLIWFTALLALFYHLFAGIRHLLMDCHVGESLAGGRLSSKIVMCLFTVVAVSLAVRIFL